MAIFSPTIYYFGQPVAAAAGFIVRPDANAASVTIAIPGTRFGSTFGQTDYRSDISGYINGGSSLNPPSAALSGSGQFASGSTNFSGDGYTTSMSRNLGNNGAIPGTSTQVAFGSSAWTIEFWWRPANETGESAGLFAYDGQVGFMQMSYDAGYYRWTGSTTGGEFTADFVSTPASNTFHHVFFSRTGNTWCGGIDGTIRINRTLTGNVRTTSPFGMMGWNGNGGQQQAAFQDFRVTKGVARYTGAVSSTYTVPLSIVTNG
jgi:hypothetical protein